MKKVTRDLIENFIVGGMVTASVSFIGTFMSPTLAAIWWSFPVSLLPSMYFMHQYGRDNKYIAKFEVNFSKKEVLNFFENKGIFSSIPKKKKLFIMPILININNNQVSLFSENPLFINWNNYRVIHF